MHVSRGGRVRNLGPAAGLRSNIEPEFFFVFMEETNLDHFTLNLDDNEELNAAVLTNLLNSGVEEALSRLSPAQLMQLERNVQKLKRQKTPSTSLTKPKPTSKKRSDCTEESGEEAGGVYEESGASTRKNRGAAAHMNLPASAPQVEFRDGFEWVHFTYSTKGHSEYCIRVDIDDLSLDEIPEDFKTENCVYPRALVPREAYIGNRWEYETAVNDIAWKLCWKNPEVLCGKRGLIQRAVDSYRNRATESRSRRVMRQDKMTTSGTVSTRRRHNSHSSSNEALYASNSSSTSSISQTQHPRSLTVSYTDKDGNQQKLKIQIDLDAVNLDEINDDFKRLNCLYPQALSDPEVSFNEGRWEYENACNELAWKLAWINAPKISGRRNLLQKAVDAYQTRIEASERARLSMKRAHQGSQVLYDHSSHELDKNEEFSQLVAHTLQQALSQHGNCLLANSKTSDHTSATTDSFQL